MADYISRINVKVVLHKWFDYKKEDDENQPRWINNYMNNYKNGNWGVGEL